MTTTYTRATLFLLGLLGLLSHNFVELNKQNRATNGKLNLIMYFKLEVFSIAISITADLVSTLLSDEIYKALTKIGYEWLLGVSFFLIGYFGQSLLIFIVGKANAAIGKSNDEGEVSKS